jgi:ABC-type branched-subunit amino acid transport system substrate-binding protein
VLGAALSAAGIYAANGTNTRNGYEFAVRKINDAGGVKIGGRCYHFKIKYYDDESTPARAAQLVERLIDQVLGGLQHNEGKTILMVEQNARKGLDFADVGCVLVSGELAVAGEGSDCLRTQTSAACF